MKYLTLLASLFISTLAIAQERPVADKEIVLELKAYCVELAEDEGTDNKSLDEYLLDCINEELEAEGYQSITVVPN